MKRVVVDASALGAFVFQEPEGAAIRDRLAGATVFAPALLRYELANTALKKARQQPVDAARILAALAIALDDTSGSECRIEARPTILVPTNANRKVDGTCCGERRLMPWSHSASTSR